jgi:LPS O-antigen subunit length determinant protein (WzzB/FepE family)
MNNDEIDLQELAIKVIRFLKKHSRLILISPFLGVSISVVLYFMIPKSYESKLILMSDILTESYTKEIAESLDILIKEKNFKTLASRLSLSEEEAIHIKKVEIESVKKEKEINGTDANIFIVTADVEDSNIFGNLQKGIMSFLRNNEFVKVRVRQRKDYYNAMIEKVGVEIQSLDSLKRRLFLGQPVYSKSAEMLLVDPTNIYSKIIELNKEQINYKNSLELVDSIQLVEGFTPFEKPASPKLSILLIIGFVGGFLFSIAFLLMSHLFKLANQHA